MDGTSAASPLPILDKMGLPHRMPHIVSDVRCRDKRQDMVDVFPWIIAARNTLSSAVLPGLPWAPLEPDGRSLGAVSRGGVASSKRPPQS